MFKVLTQVGLVEFKKYNEAMVYFKEEHAKKNSFVALMFSGIGMTIYATLELPTLKISNDFFMSLDGVAAKKRAFYDYP